MNTTITGTMTALMLAMMTGCAANGDEAVETADQNIDAEVTIQPIAGSASVQLGMVTLRDEVIVSEVAQPGPEDIKPGFEIELFAPTTLRPIAGVHGQDGLSLQARDMAVMSFAPVSAIAERAGGRQDAALYLDSAIAPDGLYSLPTEYAQKVPYTGKPGIAVGEGVCDFSSLHADDVSPYPGLVKATHLKDGEVHGGVVTMNAPGQIKIRLVAQVEHCSGPIASAAQAKAESRLCYEKLVWLKANGGRSTELGRLSAYRAPLSLAQTSYCGD